jgi:prevent-host-death family protein
MTIVNIHEAKTQLSRLLERVEAGEEVIIARAGKPVARLQPYAPARQARQPGRWKGRVAMAADFDELPAELLAAFIGEAP